MKFVSLLPFASLTSAAIHTIRVGTKGADTFTPPALNPKVGDIIVFQLESFHNIVEGTFDSPCQPKPNGFYSGEFPDTDKGRLRFVTRIVSPDPIYYYCSVGRHCQVGMVGGFNTPTSGKTLADYASRAKSVAEASEPDEIHGGILIDAAQVLKLNGTGSAQVADIDSSEVVGAMSRDVAAADAIPPWYPGQFPGVGLPPPYGLPPFAPNPVAGGPPPGVTGPPPWLPGPPPGVVGSPPPWSPAAFFNNTSPLSFLPPWVHASLFNGTAGLSSLSTPQVGQLFSTIQQAIGNFFASLQNNATQPIRGMRRDEY
ncbi:hypothetical protein BU24DRAFT_167778 [Aaosphaeria arxii CBS 175.79]|uniref:Cupredoxin n=1 Tax=Aaosphaeria arxii CBS 175.79 TaxID=1450172 RepID=A0A6A5XZ68_9PLEO|nr:uncharacterized protein BU24DRAFT_167778 [Aaosphaeria arxii CBS 175.79]KAF2018259.1 hypothetical protein BU24DRAFT_167778 [Aaosphaeria arxii CBS 175.79]